MLFFRLHGFQGLEILSRVRARIFAFIYFTLLYFRGFLPLETWVFLQKTIVNQQKTLISSNTDIFGRFIYRKQVFFFKKLWFSITKTFRPKKSKLLQTKRELFLPATLSFGVVL